MEPSTYETTDRGVAPRLLSASNIGLGIWLFLSPWMFHATSPITWDCWITAILVVVVAAARSYDPWHLRRLTLLNMFLGFWVFVSPWILDSLTRAGVLVNSVCLGLAIWSVSIGVWVGQPAQSAEGVSPGH